MLIIYKPVNKYVLYDKVSPYLSHLVVGAGVRLYAFYVSAQDGDECSTSNFTMRPLYPRDGEKNCGTSKYRDRQGTARLC
jgi:hypothetical protein